MTIEEQKTETNEKEKIKIYLESRLNECSNNIRGLRKKYRMVKIFYSGAIIVTITCSTLIAGLSSTVVPPIGITILSIVGTLSAALSVKFNLKKQKSRLEDTIRESNMIKNKLEYIITCNGDADLNKLDKFLPNMGSLVC